MNNEHKPVALVTGASGNLGKAVTEKFIKEQYTVIGTINKDDSSKNKDLETVKVDLTDEDASNKAVGSIIEKYNQVDVAVLTVGGFVMGTIAQTKTSGILHQYKLNFETAYNIAQPVFIQMLKQNSGKIFLIGSKPGLEAKNSKGMIAYGLSKSLLFRLAELMNDEAKDKNVFTTVIVPGTIDTPQNRQAMPGADFSKWQQPETIADIIFEEVSKNSTDKDEFIIKI